MTIYEEARQISSNILQQGIDLGEIDQFDKVAKAVFYEISEYNDLLKRIGAKIEDAEEQNQLRLLLCKYDFVLKQKKETIEQLIIGIKSGSIPLSFTINTEWESSLRKLVNEDEVEEVKNVVEQRIIGRLSLQHRQVMEQRYLIKKSPFVFAKSTKWEFVGSNYEQQYLNCMVMYKNMFIEYEDIAHVYVLKYDLLETYGSKNDFMNILSFLLCKPIFVYTKGYSYSKKLEKIYEECNLMDMVKLRKNQLFSDNEHEENYIEARPILKCNTPYNITEIPQMDHPEAFELYNAALKQAEPISKCVFLYRVIEYAINEHYNRTMHPQNADPAIAIEYYLNMAMQHTFIPHYYIDLGRYYSMDFDSVVVVRKSSMKDLWNTLKQEIERIKVEWIQHPHLSNKTVGEILYSNGRCATAHGHTGAQGRYNARYDYQYNYFHINNVNILLELIARYIVEMLNPKICNLVVRERATYLEINEEFLRDN